MTQSRFEDIPRRFRFRFNDPRRGYKYLYNVLIAFSKYASYMTRRNRTCRLTTHKTSSQCYDLGTMLVVTRRHSRIDNAPRVIPGE